MHKVNKCMCRLERLAMQGTVPAFLKFVLVTKAFCKNLH